MTIKSRWFVFWLTIILLTTGLWHLSMAQLEGLEEMEAPEDVTGVDCSMCHGDFATAYKYKHSPAADGTCVICHLESGEEGHGKLTDDSRGLCLSCHPDYEGHNPAVNCWASSCHSDTHGSDVDPVFNPSRQEPYPGFTESTACATYVGSQSCLDCHCEKCGWWAESAHSLSDLDNNISLDRKGCEGCHGPGSEHWGRSAGIGIFSYATVEEADNTCFKCHRDEMFIDDYWRTTHPLEGVSCTSCHSPHNVANQSNLIEPANELCFSCHKTKRADFNRLSAHPVDKKDPRAGMLCTECHNPHGAEGAGMLALPAEELCLSCHVEKAGPFVFPHVGTDAAIGNGCANCHTHHGSNTPNLLLMNGRGICLQCHTDRATQITGRNCWTTGFHTEHHGSNGNYFFFN